MKISMKFLRKVSTFVFDLRLNAEHALSVRLDATSCSPIDRALVHVGPVLHEIFMAVDVSARQSIIYG
jgi:hypothetical protein